jgi:hypothetical protein
LSYPCQKKSPTPARPTLHPSCDVDAAAWFSGCKQEKSTRLWTSRCISTGVNVRNRWSCPRPIFCPVYVQPRFKPCTAAFESRKPLSLWKKFGLSTVRRPFTITTNLYSYSYSFKTKTRKNRSQHRWPGSRFAHLVLSTEKKNGRSAATPESLSLVCQAENRR